MTRWVALSLILTVSAGCPSLATGPGEKTKMEKAEFHYQLANNSFYAQDTMGAIRDLYAALDHDPDHVQAHHLLGFIYFGRQNWSDSEKHFRRALELKPDFFEARANLGALYLAKERWAQAIETLTPLSEERLYPTPHLVHNNIGFAWFNLGDYDKALHHLKMAVFLKPHMCLAHNNLGRVYMATGRPDLAVRAFDRAFERCPEYVEPLFWLGELYRSTGQQDLARQSFQRCYDVAPESPIGSQCGEMLR